LKLSLILFIQDSTPFKDPQTLFYCCGFNKEANNIKGCGSISRGVF